MNIATVNRISIAAAISGAALTLGKMVSLWLIRQYSFLGIVVYSMITSVPYVILVFAAIGSRKSRPAAVVTYLGTLGAVVLGMEITLNPMSDKYSELAFLAGPIFQFVDSLVVWILAAILAWRFKSPDVARSRFQFSVASLLLGITAVGVLLGLTKWQGMTGGLIVVLGVGAAMVMAGIALRRYGLIWTGIAEAVVGIALTGVLVGFFFPPNLIPQTPIVLKRDTPYYLGGGRLEEGSRPHGVFKAGTKIWVNAQTDSNYLVYDGNGTEGYVSKESVK